ncbi:hypothetical protein SAMN04489860_1277 [Paraoerskovia marina]|uniref:Uncharacterized protein n=1 Tax=Paraoerskovia marina TaxID=545619 RepID=A0A1H1R720_9CELL|nr:hypothetical protein [Paraoerskovia marina]SDS31562.1 hypothetical protein SAMN04489860_1277 [Paraoerskovia marina]
MSDDPAVWRERRRDAAQEKARAMDELRRADSAIAARAIAEFVAEAGRRGLEPEPLRARGYDGRSTYRTPLRGWYLRKNRSVAVGTDGLFYVLSAPGGLTARLRGVSPEPSDPPRVLGAGGRDGESIDITDALALVLNQVSPPEPNG